MLWKSEGQPQFQESLTQLASLPPCGLAAEVWAMAKLNVNQKKIWIFMKIAWGGCGEEGWWVRRVRGEQLSKVNSLSAQSLWIEKLKIMNDTHTRTNRSILLAQIQFSTELLTHRSYLPLPPPRQRFPSSLFASLRFRSEKTTTRRVAAGKLCSPVCPTVCLCVCQCVCGCPCGLHI